MVFKKGDRVVIISFNKDIIEKGVIIACTPEYLRKGEEHYGYKVNNRWFFRDELKLDKEYYRDINLDQLLNGL